MLSQPNFLMMDEPTNHLDLIGKEALEDALCDYEGTMLFVSHDRYFISKLATAVLVIDNGKATYYPMRYQEYMHKDEEHVQAVKTVEKKETKKVDRGIHYDREVKNWKRKLQKRRKSWKHSESCVLIRNIITIIKKCVI